MASGSWRFFNQPFAIMAQLEPEWLSERPEFDRVLERMRENGRLPEVRDFPAWKAERRGWFTSPEETIEEDWMLANGDHLRILGQPLPDGGLRLIFEDRTEQVRLASARDTLLRVRAATFDNLFEVISVFASDGRLYLWNRRFSEVVGSRRKLAGRASARRRAGTGNGQAAGQSHGRRAGARAGSLDDQRPAVGHGPACR